MLNDGVSLALSMLNVFSANKYGDFNDPACPLYGQYEANLTQAKRNSHLPKFDRYNMAQLQLDVVAVKGFTEPDDLQWWDSKIQDHVDRRLIIDVNSYKCVNDSKAPRLVVSLSKAVPFHTIQKDKHAKIYIRFNYPKNTGMWFWGRNWNG